MEMLKFLLISNQKWYRYKTRRRGLWNSTARNLDLRIKRVSLSFWLRANDWDVNFKKSLCWPVYVVNSLDKTKFSCWPHTAIYRRKSNHDGWWCRSFSLSLWRFLSSCAKRAKEGLNPLTREWPASSFSIKYHPWINHYGHENQGNGMENMHTDVWV